MSDSQYAPLTASLVKALTDKLFEKRKLAATDLEKQVREIVKNDQTKDLERVIMILCGLTTNPNMHARAGGLIGIAAVAIALGKNSLPYTRTLIEAVMPSFSDHESKVRYYACESLYNVVKICKGNSLNMFDQLFDTLWRLSADTDQNVRSGSDLLERLLKDIVKTTEGFNVEKVMVLIKERIYAEEFYCRRFVISWLKHMIDIPGFDIVIYIPEIIDGLFKMLGDNMDVVRTFTENVLNQLLAKINKDNINNINIKAVIDILVVHTKNSSNNFVGKRVALIWLEKLIIVSESQLIFPHLPNYLTAVLPCLTSTDTKANAINKKLNELDLTGGHLPMKEIVDVLLFHISYEAIETRIASLKWIQKIYLSLPTELFLFMDELFPKLLSSLTDPSDEVLILAIDILAEVCGDRSVKIEYENFTLKEDLSDELRTVSPYLLKFTTSLLDMFRKEPSLMTDRGMAIIRQTCALLGPDHIYKSFSLLLVKDTNTDFISKMVSMLNIILNTTVECFELREKLRNLDTEESVDLFLAIYRCWCYQPINTLGLCLLSQNYSHAADIVKRLSKIDMTVDLLVEIDRLIQLIESPILSHVRLDLLSYNYQKPLASVLSSLLMLLPQTEAFNTLHKRLQLIPLLSVTGHDNDEIKIKKLGKEMNFQELLKHFDEVFTKRQENIRVIHKNKVRQNLSGIL
uniref:Protein VAC14 homolog n=1 Tax=Parastrongyloides trichosuri TaxID=131310 RepID=A0A0N4ZX00_PARTI